MRAPKLVLLVGALPLVAAVLFFGYREYGPAGSLPPPLRPPREPLLPDLAMPALADIRTEVDQRGRAFLSFTAAIANVGEGPLLIHAARPVRSDTWRVSQRFEEPGGRTERVTPGTIVWGGHGHNHWHVKLGASYVLTKSSDPSAQRRLQKQGFCFFDQVRLEIPLANRARLPRFDKKGCSGRSRRAFDMGLSVGWFDPYFWFYADQRIDITGLPPGAYRLTATADPDNWFLETNDGNNAVWADVRLGRRADGAPVVDVVATSPALAVR